MWLRLKSIYCTDTSEPEEEPYIKIDDPESDIGHKWGPVRMEPGDTETIDEPIEIPSGSLLSVTLYESDSVPLGSEGRSDDRIDSFDVHDGAALGRYHEFMSKYELRGDSGHYSDYRIYYEITRDRDSHLYTKPYWLWLTRLYCNDAQESEDRVYLKVDGERYFGPHKMVTRETLLLNNLIPIDSTAKIDLWEQDDTGRDDLLDEFWLDITDDFSLSIADELNHRFSWRRTREIDAIYTLYFHVTHFGYSG